jgi:hypothetical protein
MYISLYISQKSSGNGMSVYMPIVISTEEVIYEFLLSTGIGD